MNLPRVSPFRWATSLKTPITTRQRKTRDSQGRIQEIEAILRHAVIIETTGDTMSIGSRVTIQEEDFDPETYHIVGPTKPPAPRTHLARIPIGIALMNKRSVRSR